MHEHLVVWMNVLNLIVQLVYLYGLFQYTSDFINVHARNHKAFLRDLTLSMSLVLSRTTKTRVGCWFSIHQILQFCLFTYPLRWKSPEMKIILSVNFFGLRLSIHDPLSKLISFSLICKFQPLCKLNLAFIFRSFERIACRKLCDSSVVGLVNKQIFWSLLSHYTHGSSGFFSSRSFHLQQNLWSQISELRMRSGQHYVRVSHAVLEHLRETFTAFLI